MKHVVFRPVVMRLIATLVLLIGTVSVSAQYYMDIYQTNAPLKRYAVREVDSVKFGDYMNIRKTDGSIRGYAADAVDSVRFDTWEYVDLGLSVNWATCNVGASAPEDYGDFFAWGETEAKDVFYWSNYKYCKDTANALTKYCNLSEYGYESYTDSKNRLDLEDDVAHVKWGDNWRMPTYEQFFELTKKCTWTKTTRNGVVGYVITSKVSGYTDRSIFLPAAGLCYGNKYENKDELALYWTSILDSDIRPSESWKLYAWTENPFNNTSYRYTGLSVRPVCPSETWAVQELIMNYKSLSLGLNETRKISMKVMNGNYDYSTDSDVTDRIVWTSSNPAVATVAQGGIVTTQSVSGTTTITANIDGKTASCTITVYNYVNLGLTVHWATCNLGAENPEDYGNYYSWGETETKSNYASSTYKYCNGAFDALTKYCSVSQFGDNGFVDSKTKLDVEDDVAHVLLGGKWRMPTKDECDELVDNCTWTWTTLNGVNGYLVTSNKPGYTDRSIFLPANGNRVNTSLNLTGTYGRYWGKSLNTTSPYNGCGIMFDSNKYESSSNNRELGLGVRPIFDNIVTGSD